MENQATYTLTDLEEIERILKDNANVVRDVIVGFTNEFCLVDVCKAYEKLIMEYVQYRSKEENTAQTEMIDGLAQFLLFPQV